MDGEEEEAGNHDVRLEVARAWELLTPQYFTSPEEAGAEAADTAFKRALKRVRTAAARLARRT